MWVKHTACGKSVALSALSGPCGRSREQKGGTAESAGSPGEAGCPGPRRGPSPPPGQGGGLLAAVCGGQPGGGEAAAGLVPAGPVPAEPGLSVPECPAPEASRGSDPQYG